MRHYRHQIAGLFVAVSHFIDLPVNAAINGMYESVAMPGFVGDEECPAKNPFSFRRESKSHGIIHPTRKNRFQSSVVGASAENVSSPAFEVFAVSEFVGLFRKRAFTPVNPAIRAKIRAVQIVRATG